MCWSTTWTRTAGVPVRPARRSRRSPRTWNGAIACTRRATREANNGISRPHGRRVVDRGTLTERDGLLERAQANEGGQRAERPPPIPPVHAVVPGEPDRLRARTRGGNAEPEAVARAVEEPRAQVQAAELPPEQAALDGARVAAKAPVPARVRDHDRVGGEHPVLEREGDALAHERVAPGRVADQERVRRGHPRAGRMGPDGERLPSRRFRADARELDGELVPQARAIDRREPVDADVRVRHAVDDAGERPAIAAQPRRARGEVELVAPRGVAVPARVGNGHVAHDGARHRARAVAHEPAAYDAPAAVRADHDGCPVGTTVRLDAYARAVARETHDA